MINIGKDVKSNERHLYIPDAWFVSDGDYIPTHVQSTVYLRDSLQ